MSNISTLEAIPQCYATPSAGMHTSHTLPLKLQAIADAGFRLAEIAFPDLEAYAQQENPNYKKIGNRGRGDVDVLCQVARKISSLCEKLGLKVLAVHPFSKFEGYEDLGKREESFDRATTWFKVLKALNCQMLQVGSTDDPSASSDLNVISRDLRQLADEAIAQDPPIKIAYELWAWGTHTNTWEGVWEISARTYMLPDPPHTTHEDIFPSPPGVPVPLHLTSSLRRLTEVFSEPAAREKIFYFQISDGSGPGRVSSAELTKTAKEKGISPLYAWSNAWRPLPYMEDIDPGTQYGGFLPVLDVIEAVLRTGWRGPWSYEVFYEADMSRDDPGVPLKWTKAAMESRKRIFEALKPFHMDSN